MKGKAQRKKTQNPALPEEIRIKVSAILALAEVEADPSGAFWG